MGDILNRYICPLYACRYLALIFFIQAHPQSDKLPGVADFGQT